MATWYTATEMDTWHSDAFDFTWADNDKKVTLTLKNGYQWPPGQTYQIAGSHYIKDKNGLGAYTNDVFRIEPNEFTPFVPRSQTVAFSVAADTQAPPQLLALFTPVLPPQATTQSPSLPMKPLPPKPGKNGEALDRQVLTVEIQSNESCFLGIT